ncbi:uncharacterized protein HRG_10827 [Hirsutella rhossiliensis]|uniref:Uncharacterized protein n=1 Tax=Hirsutella rhossiliensis TaxID=111463 RepID=A0A9P8MNC3_9HYPO|nr:uncharacterized protein HRG_10827 [Hirsutella rhossiliensis]KAH0958132.1 hypothetical protein HRG_10827 [Hirsutella rhossiliensis]
MATSTIRQKPGTITVDGLRIVVNVGNGGRDNAQPQGLGHRVWPELTLNGAHNKRDLANLRLVNHRFCTLATNVLFSHIGVSYDVDKSDEANAARLRKLLSLSDDIYHSSNRRVRVNFNVPATPQQLDQINN